VTARARKVNVNVDVTGHAPNGCHLVATDLFVPSQWDPSPTLWCCVPGGGISRAYFDLDVPGSFGEYSMANYLAERGEFVLTIDPPGVGGSDLPDDGYTLTPRAVADVLHFVVEDVLTRMAAGSLEGLPAISCRATLGVGHSAGGLLVACQQGRSRTFGALALLGFSNGGLPAVLTEREASFTDRAEALVAVLPELARERFGDPLPPWSNAHSRLETPGELDAEIEAAASRASSRLLAMVGLTALVPGSIKPELNQIDVPTFVAVGQEDIVGDIAAIPAQLPSCNDLTLLTLEGAGHNHNVARSRIVLWDRLLGWAASVAPASPADLRTGAALAKAT
jgi:pimeloyl-ACP methyl ester carboxylesterase